MTGELRKLYSPQRLAVLLGRFNHEMNWECSTYRENDKFMTNFCHRWRSLERSKYRYNIKAGKHSANVRIGYKWLRTRYKRPNEAVSHESRNIRVSISF
jgi:hypothetical protein